MRGNQRDRTPADMGEDFDFDDEQEMRRRLPRLAALCLGDNAALCRTGSSEAGRGSVVGVDSQFRSRSAMAMRSSSWSPAGRSGWPPT
jgi:hypothetical protein